jgi:PAS domain S-box-containing protein
MTLWTAERAAPAGSTALLAKRKFQDQLTIGYRRADQLFAVLLILEWSVAVVFALLVAPYAWNGDAASTHNHLWAAVFLGGVVVCPPIALAMFRPGAPPTRHAIAVAQMLISALLIHLSAGRVEAHFHVFGSLAFLALYRDWKVLVSASVVVALDHILRGLFWPQSVYGVLTASPWRWVEHAGWVVFEDIVLIRGCVQSLGELRELALRQAELECSYTQVEQIVRERTALLSEANEALTRQATELRASEALMSSIIETAPDAIMTLDEFGRIEEFNPAAESMFGYPKRDAEGRPLHDLVAPPGVRGADCDGIARLLPRGNGRASDRRLEVKILRAGGSEFPAELTVTPVEREDVPPMFVGFVHDITERKIAEESLRQAAETALAASRAESEFLANMSHEIRTPMNGVIGMTELALETELTPRQREYLNLVKSSAESLLTVINDILDFSKIEAGKLNLDQQPFSLRHVLDETLQALALRAHAKDLELACRIAPDVPDALIGDAGRLRQVLLNLVGNAIKFTERGEVLASVGLEEPPREGITLRVAVADTGIGIPSEKLRSIFQPFEQADNSTTRRFGGTGLGLTISAKLVELMGGRIWVESTPGRGTTFWFTVKLCLQPSDGLPSAVPRVTLLEDLPVLIVDDNATNRLILEEVLSSWGASPVAVDGGFAALELLRSAADRQAPFPIALVDGMMPVMDGLDLAEQIRRDPSIAAIRLLILTSAGEPEDTARSRALEISACLTKPVRQSELYDAVTSAMAGWSQPAEIRRPRPAAHEGATPIPGPSGLRILLAEDHPVNQKVAVRMLEHLGHQVVVAPDGRRALVELDNAQFDLVLMDLQMPEMDGFEALGAIREREGLSRRHLPVIALTAHAMHGDRERCLRAGFDSYLAKPIRQVDLHQALAALDLRAPAAPDSEQTPHRELLEICGGDDDFARELAESFLDTAPPCLVEIDAALAASNLAALATPAHALKGASRTIGAKHLADACEALERAARRVDAESAAAAGTRAREAWEQLRSVLEDLLVVEIEK